MAAIPRERPARHTVLRSFAGHLESPPDTVYAALIARRGELAAGDESASLDDASDRILIVQGAWWYRAEYRVLPEGEGGSLVEFEIVNVAERMHWAGPLAGRAAIRHAPHDFQALLTAIA